jgi:hypothetical protein
VGIVWPFRELRAAGIGMRLEQQHSILDFLRGFFVFFLVWWCVGDLCVFAEVFGESGALDVVILWFLRGEMCGEGGQETVIFWRLNFSHSVQVFFRVALVDG